MYCRQHTENSVMDLPCRCSAFDVFYHVHPASGETRPLAGLFQTVENGRKRSVSTLDVRSGNAGGDPTKRARKTEEELPISSDKATWSRTEHGHGGKGGCDVKVESSFSSV